MLYTTEVFSEGREREEMRARRVTGDARCAKVRHVTAQGSKAWWLRLAVALIVRCELNRVALATRSFLSIRELGA